MAEIIVPAVGSAAAAVAKFGFDKLKEAYESSQQQPSRKQRNPSRTTRSRGRGGRPASQPRVQATPKPKAQKKKATKIENSPVMYSSQSSSFHREMASSGPFKNRYNKSHTSVGEFQLGTVDTLALNVAKGENLALFTVNPTFYKGSRLSYETKVWQRYHFEYITVKYIPLVGAAENGAIAIGIQDNVSLPIPGTGQVGLNMLLNFKGATEGNVGHPFNVRREFHTPTQPFLCSPVDGAGIEATLVNQGRIIVKSCGNLATNKSYGFLKLEYKIHFYEESFPYLTDPYSATDVFQFGNYYSTKIFPTGAYHYYITPPDNAKFPVDNNEGQTYFIICNEDFTFSQYNFYTQTTYNVDVTAGMTFWGYQAAGDANISFIWENQSDMRIGPTASIYYTSSYGPFSRNFTIHSANIPDKLLPPIGEELWQPEVHAAFEGYKKNLMPGIDKKLFVSFKASDLFKKLKTRLDKESADIVEDPSPEVSKPKSIAEADFKLF